MGQESPKNPNCKRANCTGLVKARGLCFKHYETLRKQLREERLATERARGKVPTAPIVDHLNRLRGMGIGLARIAELTDLKRWVLWTAYEQEQMYADDAARIMALVISTESAPEVAADGAKVCSVGTARRLQGLVALGYDNKQIAEALGITRNHVAKFIYGHRPLIIARNAMHIAEAVRRLEVIPPRDSLASRKAKVRAETNGWVSTMAWDEDTIDDPAAKPHLGGKRVDWLEEYQHLVDTGIPPKTVAKRLNIKWETVTARLRRMEKKRAA